VVPSLHVGSRLAGWMAAALAYTLAVVLTVHVLELPEWAAGNELAALLGVGLGTMIVFRNNAANDRWWEARKLWGQLINDIRNLALKAQVYAGVDDDEHREFARLLVGFAHALRLHLRGRCGVRAVPGFENEPTSFPHAPGYIAGLVHRTLSRWNREARLENTIWLLDRHARALMDVCGACERIANTPLASSYRALFRWGIAIYVLAAPWAVTMALGWGALPALATAFGFLLGVELTAEEVEQPFGTEGDDLPLETYCETIEKFVDATLEHPAAGGQG
jgi:putative membrane protein